MRSSRARRSPACGGSAAAAATARSPQSAWPSGSPSSTTRRPAVSSCSARLASAEINGYRLDMALRWAALHRVAAVAAFSAEQWQPAVTALDITGPADIALVSHPRRRRPRRPCPGDLPRRSAAAPSRPSAGPGRAWPRCSAPSRRARVPGKSARPSAARSASRSNTARPRGAAIRGPTPARTPATAATRRPELSMPVLDRRGAVRVSSRRRTPAVTWASRPAWCCTPRPRPPRGPLTWPGGHGTCRPGHAASCSPSCCCRSRRSARTCSTGRGSWASR